MIRRSLASTLLIFACFFANAHTNSNGIHGTNGTDSSQFAVLYVYTASYFRDYFILNIDSGAVGPIFANSKLEIKLYKEGDRLVSVEGKSLEINVEYGKEYYVDFQFRKKTFNTTIKLDLVSTEEGKLAYQKITFDSFFVDNKSYMQLPKLLEPSPWCKKIQTAWNNLLEDHIEIRNRFDSIPAMSSYYFYIVFIIDTSGKLTIKDPVKFTPKTPKGDSLCFRALYGVLQETQWQPPYIIKKDGSRSVAPMEGHAQFTITSKGFQSVDVIKRINYPGFSTVPYDDRVFYSCNCGR
jgi:hypothetical protein